VRARLVEVEDVINSTLTGGAPDENRGRAVSVPHLHPYNSIIALIPFLAWPHKVSDILPRKAWNDGGPWRTRLRKTVQRSSSSFGMYY
jgi:hypothetical protein